MNNYITVKIIKELREKEHLILLLKFLKMNQYVQNQNQMKYLM